MNRLTDLSIELVANFLLYAGIFAPFFLGFGLAFLFPRNTSVGFAIALGVSALCFVARWVLVRIADRA
ncbi:MAG TPA: hypothetical protein VD997_11930 [Phycisphaerales bacterium]|nr:hypothetical protein [Phycisphaerales bacterium]